MFFKYIVFVLLTLFPFKAYAQGCDVLRQDGLKGEGLVSVAVDPKDENVVFVGTEKGLYKKDLKTSGPWKPFSGLPSGGSRINQILIDHSKETVYIGTSRGLFVSQVNSVQCQNIFSRSDALESDCLSVALCSDDLVFVATKGGLFIKKAGEKEWSKCPSPFGNEPLVYLYAQGNVIYVAVQSGVYSSDDRGKRWSKIFNAYSYRENSSEEPSDVDLEEGELESSPVRHITGIDGNSSILYVLSAYGVFKTEDAGKNFSRLPLAGLNVTNSRYLFIEPFSKRVFVVAKTGVYEFNNEQWHSMAIIYDAKQMAQSSGKLILITSREVLSCANPKDTGSVAADKLLVSFNNEPTVEEVQKMAIRYGEVSNEKINDWRRKAAVKAALPTVSFGYNNNVYGTSKGEFSEGPNDWDFNVSWDLSDLVYNDAQTSIDTRSKLMVQLRNDILSEATRIYFERRKLQLELLSKKEIGQEEEIDKKLRLAELTALLDRLTGGQFSANLKKTF